ncbi:unnamed protein product [Owenia fusiformis]|uniref:Uncharacterized protein n=1 Tax=Owenia fusiformis TaxID=6347 RepID=A0A8J1Y1V5_OWEFU|nr:unnamed protein product [Owenia fusiformis]
MDGSTVEEVQFESDATVIIFTVLSTLLCAISVLTNSLTTIIVIYLPKQTPFSKLFVNLAICDILGTFAIYIGDGFYRAGIHWNLLSLERLNSIFIVAGICFNLLFLTSTVTLLVFAIMRFIAIKKPHLFKLYFASSKKILIYICLCWIISTCVAFPSIICEYTAKEKCGGIHKQSQNSSNFFNTTFQIEDNLTNFLIEDNLTNLQINDVTINNITDEQQQSCPTEAAYVVCYQWKYSWAVGKGLILIIIVLLYIYVSRDLFKRCGSFRDEDCAMRNRRNDQHAFITIVILIVTMVLLGVPYIIVKVYRRAVFSQTTIAVYHHFITYFPYINFILDPLVYSIRSPDIYAKYKSVIDQISCKQRNQRTVQNAYEIVSGTHKGNVPIATELRQVNSL